MVHGCIQFHIVLTPVLDHSDYKRMKWLEIKKVLGEKEKREKGKLQFCSHVDRKEVNLTICGSSECFTHVRFKFHRSH